MTDPKVSTSQQDASDNAMDQANRAIASGCNGAADILIAIAMEEIAEEDDNE
jgi:hypothetical protein